MSNPIEIFQNFLISFGLTGVANVEPLFLGLIMIAVLAISLRLLVGIIQNIAKLIVTVATLGMVAWILIGMFSG